MKTKFKKLVFFLLCAFLSSCQYDSKLMNEIEAQSINELKTSSLVPKKTKNLLQKKIALAMKGTEWKEKEISLKFFPMWYREKERVSNPRNNDQKFILVTFVGNVGLRTKETQEICFGGSNPECVQVPLWQKIIGRVKGRMFCLLKISPVSENKKYDCKISKQLKWVW